MPGITHKLPGLLIPALLDKAGYNPSRLQKLTGAGQSTSYDWCNGSRSPLSRDLRRIAKALKLPIEKLEDAAAHDRAARAAQRVTEANVSTETIGNHS